MQDVSHTEPKDPFFEEDGRAAEGFLLMAQDHRRLPQELTVDDFWNMLDSIQWCYDNERWEMVIEFAMCLQDFFEQQGFWKEGIHCINWALNGSTFSNNTTIRAQLSFNLGLLYDRQGKRTEAERHYQTSADLARIPDQSAVLTDAKHRLGWIAHLRRDYSQAQALYYEAKALRESLDPPDPLALSRSWQQLGILAQDMGNYELARENYEKALDIRRDKNETYLIASSLHQLGALAVEQKEWKRAKDYFEEALTIRRSLKDRAGEALALDQLGVIAHQQQQWDLAWDYYKKSLDLQEELVNVSETIRGKFHLGEICLGRGNLPQARQWFEKCLEESRQLKDEYFRARAYLQLGKVFYLESDFKQAETYYRHSLKILSSLDGTQREQAGILYQLGRLALQQGQLDVAYRAYRDSLEIQKGGD